MRERKRVKRMSRGGLLVALEVIEKIVGDEFCFDLDLRDASKRLRGDKRIMHQKLMAIYRIAHSVNETHSCYHVHDDWRKEAATVQP